MARKGGASTFDHLIGLHLGFLFSLPLPLALAGVCGIQNLAIKNPLVNDSYVLGQELGIPGFPGHKTLYQCAIPITVSGAEPG